MSLLFTSWTLKNYEFNTENGSISLFDITLPSYPLPRGELEQHQESEYPSQDSGNYRFDINIP